MWRQLKKMAKIIGVGNNGVNGGSKSVACRQMLAKAASWWRKLNEKLAWRRSAAQTARNINAAQ